jgi:hypothetical protein
MSVISVSFRYLSFFPIFSSLVSGGLYREMALFIPMFSLEIFKNIGIAFCVFYSAFLYIESTTSFPFALLSRRHSSLCVSVLQLPFFNYEQQLCQAPRTFVIRPRIILMSIVATFTDCLD